MRSPGHKIENSDENSKMLLRPCDCCCAFIDKKKQDERSTVVLSLGLGSPTCCMRRRRAKRELQVECPVQRDWPRGCAGTRGGTKASPQPAQSQPAVVTFAAVNLTPCSRTSSSDVLTYPRRAPRLPPGSVYLISFEVNTK